MRNFDPPNVPEDQAPPSNIERFRRRLIHRIGMTPKEADEYLQALLGPAFTQSKEERRAERLRENRRRHYRKKTATEDGRRAYAARKRAERLARKEAALRKAQGSPSEAL